MKLDDFVALVAELAIITAEKEAKETAKREPVAYFPLPENQSHKSHICQVPGHDSADCIVGWCECKCHEADDVFREYGMI